MSLKRFIRQIPYAADYGGVFALGVTSGIIPATPLANKEVFQFRWNPSNRNFAAVIRKIEVSAAVSTTYFAAGVPVELALYKASAWSVQGTLGNGVTPAALLKKDSGNDFGSTARASTLVAAGDIRYAGTDANGLGAGTKTLETVAMASILSGAPITSSLSGQIFAPGTPLLRAYDGDYPLVLRPGAAAASSEGFVIAATAPATGTWRLSVNVEWEETQDFPLYRS